MSQLDQVQRAHANALRGLAAAVANLVKRDQTPEYERIEIIDLFVELGFDEDEALDAILKG
jgi:hypothetical protein